MSMEIVSSCDEIHSFALSLYLRCCLALVVTNQEEKYNENNSRIARQSKIMEKEEEINMAALIYSARNGTRVRGEQNELK